MQRIVQDLKSSIEGLDIQIWHDNPIYEEQPWKLKDESRLSKTDIFLLLVSDTFMHSQFIQQLEFKMIIDQYKNGKSTVIPVILDKCPWDIDFRSDDYNFNLNELRVLPEEAKPIKDWDSQEEVYKNSVVHIRSEIAVLLGEDTIEEPKKEEQVALSFTEESETEKRIKEENRLQQEVEDKSKIEKEKEQIAEKEVVRKAEEERPKKEADSKHIAEVQRLSDQAAETKRKEKEDKRKAEIEAKRIAEEEQRAKRDVKPQEHIKEPLEVEKNSKKRIFIGAGVTVVAILCIWIFSTFNTPSDKESKREEPITSEEVKNSVTPDKVVTETADYRTSFSKLTVGDFHAGGMVFALNTDNRGGKIVHLEDAGPMTWENAIQIHEQLGEGWRLPTFDELLVVQKTVGQGGDNNAEFSNGLYWSATDFDEYQARLLRFRDANRSYHYNKVAEHRKYRVRAIRDFSQ